MGDARPAEHFAYIPVQCYADVRTQGGARNPCYVCHRNAPAPNFAADGALQREYRIPALAASNRWQNTLAPPSAAAIEMTDAELTAYVRQSNYWDRAGGIALRAYLEPLAPEWDGAHDGKWDGFMPDAQFHFDDEGFDQAADGADTGWRAYAYRPFPGHLATNSGSLGDVLIRLDPRLREDERGQYSRAVYRVNLAVVEALILRRDVSIAETDERALGVDLDLNGELSTATRVTFDRNADVNTGKTRMRYVGAVRALQNDERFPIAVGSFPLNTELLHSVRYLDVADGAVRMAARMKELRYAKKFTFLSYADLKAKAMSEAVEQAESPDGSREQIWQFDRGISNGQGWLYQGFIEAADGRLRPESFAETVPCIGCHGGVGATADSSFSFSRKLPASAFQGGWFHPSQQTFGDADVQGSEGGAEYAEYLRRSGGSDFLDNEEIRHGLFALSTKRALALDRAYLAIVRLQSFTSGRDATLGGGHILSAVPSGGKTGIRDEL